MTAAVSLASLTVRTWLRYLAPLTLLAAIAMIVVAYPGGFAKPAGDFDQAKAQARFAWIIAGSAWMFQLWLVAAAAPLVRGLVAGAPVSQREALVGGARGMRRAALPILVAVVAIVVGGLALVVPGVVLLVLLATTGAAERPLVQDRLQAAISFGRAHAKTLAIVVGIVLAVDVAIVIVAQTLLIHPVPKKPPLALLVPYRTLVRVVAFATIVVSPLAASAIAAVHAKWSSAARTSDASRATATPASSTG
jgi:hypothetical protein